MTKHRLWTADAKVHGRGAVLFKWHPEGQFVATAGQNKIVHIFTRNGEVVDEILLESGPCSGLDWDSDGEKLAMMQESSGIVQIWDLNTKRTTNLDTGMRDLSYLKWAKNGPQLAIGTAKGHLVIYNKKTQRKLTTMGKHTKRIISGAWNIEGKLALGGEDKFLSISNAEGDGIDQTSIKYDPVDIQFADMKTIERGSSSRESTITVNMGGKTIFLYNINDSDNPIELAFQPRYGNIVSFRWFGEGYIMLGFSAGYLVVISSLMKEIGQELFSYQFHKESLQDIAVCSALRKAATCGDKSVKIIDLSDWKDVKTETITLEEENGMFDKIDWTRDGQILSFSTKSGCFYNYLTKLPVLNSGFGRRMMYLSSLRELSILDTAAEKDDPKLSVQVAMEPSLIGLGQNHAAVAVNNRGWFYRARKGAQGLISERDYLGTVEDIKLSKNYAAVLAGGKVQLHLIEPNTTLEGNMKEGQLFPLKDSDIKVVAIALSDDFLIYATNVGSIHYFHILEWAMVNEYKHSNPIRKIFANYSGTRLVFVDSKLNGFLYNPVNDQVIEVPKFSSNTTKVMWDPVDWGVFVTCDAAVFSTYVYSLNSIKGATINLIDNTKMTPNLHPALLFNGQVISQNGNGLISMTMLATHDAIGPPKTLPADQLRYSFTQNLRLLRFKDAWEIALLLKNREHWNALAQAALEQLDVQLAMRVYRQLGDAGMVLTLQNIASLEERNLLAGYIAMLNQDYSASQQYFLASTRPITALEMRRDLHHWDHALKLASTLDPSQIPYISREYGQQLEFKGQYHEALRCYEAAQTGEDNDHNRLSQAGAARMMIRAGDISRGVSVVINTGDKNLCRDCAQILEMMKQFNDAAVLYVKAEMYEKAVSLYIQSKNFSQATPLMKHVTNTKLLSSFAKAKEAERDYKEAVKYYELAKDYDNFVRLNLEQVNDPAKAFGLIRQTRIPSSALIIAKFCKENEDFSGAIEFMLIGQKSEEAFALAQSKNEVEHFATCLGDKGTTDDYLKLAEYFEGKGEQARAGEFYTTIGQYQKAMKLFLQCGESCVKQAIDVVGKAKNEVLTNQLIDFLMGETDGIPKDPKYIFSLYMAMKNYVQAGKTAIIIARQEQELGNYKVAHDLLFDTYGELLREKIRIPADLVRNLMILHSYILVKTLVKQGEHMNSARMLIRVAKNISKFPSHIVPILTSTVIECHRSGLKRSAFEYASTLMRPEYRNNIMQQYKQKIERIVRRPEKEEEDEPLSPCPFCSYEIQETRLDCPSCRNNVPYCIATVSFDVTHLQPYDFS
eukprot:TRINITY_DN11025_c0_g1_i1.p1 TRINITY_DN11025_c0_g1~~TRINITY_DN11025_c0_g1_i1.p1  ORF type:complete len:1293 (+),score=269.64 TRINITY_DN11025_c0_g1_i1:166-4044(+)